MSTPIIKTAPGSDFHSTGEASKHLQLFAVAAGVPMLDALQSASDLLDMIGCPIYAAAMGEQPLQDNQAWLVNHALKSAKAVIDSLIRSIEHPDSIANQRATE